MRRNMHGRVQGALEAEGRQRREETGVEGAAGRGEAGKKRGRRKKAVAGPRRAGGGYVQGIHEYEIALGEPRVKGCCSCRLLLHGRVETSKSGRRKLRERARAPPPFSFFSLSFSFPRGDLEQNSRAPGPFFKRLFLPSSLGVRFQSKGHRENVSIRGEGVRTL